MADINGIPDPIDDLFASVNRADHLLAWLTPEEVISELALEDRRVWAEFAVKLAMMHPPSTTKGY